MSYYIAQNQGGVLPLTYPFEVPLTGNLTLGFSGSCWASLPGAICGVEPPREPRRLIGVSHAAMASSRICR